MHFEKRIKFIRLQNRRVYIVYTDKFSADQSFGNCYGVLLLRCVFCGLIRQLDQSRSEQHLATPNVHSVGLGPGKRRRSRIKCEVRKCEIESRIKCEFKCAKMWCEIMYKMQKCEKRIL